MAEIKTLAATVRSGTGKGAARSVRREGNIPGVIYGGGEAPTPITLNYREINKLIYAGHFLTTIFELDIDGKKERAIPRDYQLDVVRDTPMHVDFLRLKAGSRIKVAVPVHFLNQDVAPGIKRGGTVNIVLHAVDMLVPADNIPEAITIDLSTLDFNDTVHIKSIELAPNCTPVDKSNFTIVTIAPPPGGAAAAAEEAAAAAAAAAPAAAAAAPAKGKK
ncbi:LSU ribosomal protein L25P [Rhodoblastus acidophilus]|uniref:Large ribosomal subunit protein bL25 n=1 Tax=Rhodoblastus acidophilus TaxID=1074 RepID=A0A212R416_RHOAC|nr:50S ribosomal protein L25/general stress protein Ctc [Rhodoblastus acidophilus]MCW2314804.1 large subunit ribosomal protein L25 [Rhodoblastus acidophilus]PPQ40206.1 50S ribosomal protein L25/general stress protein Ctc [Rhodoblastus acidophilus]SNB66776.1 LSU ribosomal protein L25P [Rhodoblastus acidophilus]